MAKLLTHKEIMEMFGVGKSKAYSIIHQLNFELNELGFLVVKGRVPYTYLVKRFNIKEDSNAYQES
jgi:hypothetical protein